MGQIKLIAGLGNPGKEYEGTRHNLGFDVVDAMASRYMVTVKKKKFNSLYGEVDLAGNKLILLKPQQYMNLSGHAVATVCGFYKISIEDILVVTDDLALDPGMIRLRAKGSAGGHNGLSDIIQKLGSNNFARLRVGIGKSPYPDSKGYVLGKPDSKDKELLSDSVKRSVEAVECWVKNGPLEAMNKFNVKNV